MSLTHSPDRADVNETSLAGKVVSVSTSAVELFTGGSRNPNRQSLTIYNDGNAAVFLGPATVTATGSTKGIPLEKSQVASIPIGDVAYYAITASGTVSLIIQELS